ncbi:MFS transporter [Actinomadura luteofluorescens]|uniref:MFS transporter n=1 Tax=Actinomadura luteofluorescens TaxID=46163 RepID=UPI003626A6B6
MAAGRAARRRADHAAALLRHPVFALGAAISFAVGFAMFGALTFLPIFLQVVHGVSPTLSGVYLLPMMLGMLLSSIGSGQLITRFGRYKIYPMVGTPIIALALYLCSALDENSTTLSMSLRFALLGFGLGLVMQVLVIAVQNAVSYQDLGSATSGVTFFRQIGGSFGVAVFGSIFSNQLAGHVADLARVLPPGFDPAAVQGNPRLLDRYPVAVKDAVLHAYAQSIDSVFFWAVPVAAAAFVLTWFLREVPLRETAQTPDYGEGFGAAPTVRSSRHEMERALSELMRRDARAFEMYDRLAAFSGVSLPAGSVWALCRIAKDGTVTGQELADRAGVRVEQGRPYVDRLVDAATSSGARGSSPSRRQGGTPPSACSSPGARGSPGIWTAGLPRSILSWRTSCRGWRRRPSATRRTARCSGPARGPRSGGLGSPRPTSQRVAPGGM